MTAKELQIIIHALRLDYTEIAKDMNYSKSAVRTWIYRDRIPNQASEKLIRYFIGKVKEQKRILDQVDAALLAVQNTF